MAAKESVIALYLQHVECHCGWNQVWPMRSPWDGEAYMRAQGSAQAHRFGTGHWSKHDLN